MANCVPKCEEAADKVRRGEWTTPMPVPRVLAETVHGEPAKAHPPHPLLVQSSISSYMEKAESFIESWAEPTAPTMPPVNCTLQCAGLYSPQRPANAPTPPPDVNPTNCVAKCEEAAEKVRTGVWTTPTPFPSVRPVLVEHSESKTAPMATESQRKSSFLQRVAPTM